MLAPSAPQSFYLHEDSPHRRRPLSWEVMGGRCMCVHLRLPKASFLWRANSPRCAQAAGRAPAPRPKLPKDAESKPIWSRSAWLPCRGMGARGAQVSRTPSLVLFSLDGMKKALERTNLCGAMVLRFPERDAITKSSSLGSKIHRCETRLRTKDTHNRTPNRDQTETDHS